MDNKSTGKSYLMIGFLEFIVCKLRLLESFRIIYLLKGHSVSQQDVSNEPVSLVFFSQEKWLVRPGDVAISITRESKHQSATVMSNFFDWSKSLFINDNSIPAGLADVQIIHASVCGMYSFFLSWDIYFIVLISNFLYHFDLFERKSILMDLV